MARNYPKLAAVEFGRQLLASGDLDPVYPALISAIPDPLQLRRWLVAYWCFYSTGLACYASEKSGWSFWDDAAFPAAVNEVRSPIGQRWPRGHERRHARGVAGLRMVKHLRERYGAHPEEMVDWVAGGAPRYEVVSDRVQDHVLFGPWIAFKVADMLERVCQVPVDFTEAIVFMFKEPATSAVELWEEELAPVVNDLTPTRSDKIKASVTYLQEHFAGEMAPPAGDRPVALQELETILCKWKSHRHGHYPLYNDLRELHESCRQWGRVSPTARRFLEVLPEIPPCRGMLL